MAALKYKEEHNKVGYLLKPTGSDDYHHIIDFLSASHITYALTSNPIIFDSLVKQFWLTATLREPKLGPLAILATIDKTPYTITEELVRSRLHLADDGGFADLPILKIYSRMDNIGYVTEGKLTFFKNKFSPQWRGMVSNIGNAKKFLMYPRFLQTILGIETRVNRQYKVLAFSSKLFANMRLNFAGHPMALLPAMLLQAQAGAGRCTFRRRFTYLPLRSSQAPPSPSVPTGGPPDTFGVLLATSVIPLGVSDAPTGALTILLGTFAVPAAALAAPVDSPNAPADSPHIPAGVSSKGKSLMADEDIPINARKFRQMEEDILGEEAAKRLHEEEIAQLERVRVEEQRKKQQKVLDYAMYYNESYWLNIRAQVEANASLSKSLLGGDVPKSPDAPTPSMPEVPISPGVTSPPSSRTRRKSLSRKHINKSNSTLPKLDLEAPAQTFLKVVVNEDSDDEDSDDEVWSAVVGWEVLPTPLRQGLVLEEPSSKRTKSPEAPTPSMPEVPISPAVTLPPSSRTKRKSLGQKHMPKSKYTLPKLDLDAPAQTFLKVVVNEDSGDKDSDDEVWSAVVGWEVLPTNLGAINALYHIDGSTKHFATLRQILHMVDRQDLLKLYGLVVQYYETHPITGAGLLSRVIFKVFNSPMLHLPRVEMVINSPWIMPILGTKELASPEQTAPGYVIPTGRVVSPGKSQIVIPG
nr:synaptobrevin, longin-like domain protein [Tanacetum cinerariifolium]